MPETTGKLTHKDGRDMDAGTFLKAYAQQRYARPSNTVDLLIFTVTDTDLKVLLIKRGGHPDQGSWAFPGGFVDVGDSGLDRPEGQDENQGEDLEDAAMRELGEEAFGRTDDARDYVAKLLSERNVHLEQLYTFGKAGRDPRTRVIGVAYFALVPPDVVPLIEAGDDADEAKWFSVEEEVDWDNLAFDHREILRVGVERLRGKIDYSDIAFSLVPQTFTVAEMRQVHEAIKGKSYDSSNFRRRFRRMQSDGIIEEAPGKRQTTTRPAKVYRFKGR
jgi:8-oxo-dGTP diphosphatase